MTDKVVQTQGNGSPERVAYDLLKLVALAEGIGLDRFEATTKDWILDTYADCLAATTHQRRPKKP